MNRKSSLFVVVLMAVAACGGGESGAEDTSPAPSTTAAAPTTTEVPATSAPQTATTTSGGSAEGEGTQVCETMEADLEANQDVDVFDPAAFEESSRRSLEAIESVAGRVPGEIEEEFTILLEANRDLVALFEDHGWDMTAVPEDDPRIVRMGDPEVLAAAEAVIDFCQLDDPAGGGGESGESGSIEELLPPQAGEVLSTEPIYIVESAASYEDLVDHYQELLGTGPVNEGDEGGLRTASFVADYGGGRVALWVEETADGILVEISAGP